ncbi:MAG: potassium-transporting ATPase subunit KdpA, partial [Planctomycetaceae bacterium]|nr:potassium-transporting ATPase subunit KdpA [Planctomycetaceae bacterium]
PKNMAAAESAAEQPPAKKVPGAPLLVALFTSTSAACVTGLVVVPTGTYWSRTGQTIILCLFQIGGLGIMTWGALFAVAVRSQMSIGQSATLGEMLESEKLANVRQLLKTILLFTVGAEAVGAVLLSGLWADKPLGEQIFQSVFHSVSAFCNAGFALTIDSFMGWSTRWQVWLAVPLLIILGGLGFAVALNLGSWVRWRWQAFRAERRFELLHHRARISLTARMVLFSTLFLLVGGAVSIFLLETPARDGIDPLSVRIADAWFQSVTFRTAGFNTVDHGALQPSTRLLAILLMFIGASPGSTGGGVKTIAMAVAVLAVFSVLRGRERLEICGRSIPNEQVSRALTIIFLGMLVTMGTTMLLVVFENQPDQFLNQLYEAASACGTVGVSTGLTADLSTPSKLVLIVAMFLGRVGPLTLLLALAGRARTARYEFPSERVVLG